MHFIIQILNKHQLISATDELISFSLFIGTNRCYLVFTSRQSKPIYAIKFMPVDTVKRVMANTLELHQSMPNLIPKPVCTGLWGEDGYYIEKAIDRSMHFTLNENATNLNVSAFKDKCLNSLQLFSATVAIKTHWQVAINIQQELTQLWKRMANSSEFTLSSWRTEIDKIISLPTIQPVIESHFQHGDFCLNNLIIQEDAVHCIDLEEFGDCSIPLYDEFSLAISFFNTFGNKKIEQLIDDINICISPKPNTSTIDALMLHKLLLFTLLYKIDKNHKYFSRRTHNQYLKNLLISYLENSDKFFLFHHSHSNLNTGPKE